VGKEGNLTLNLNPKPTKVGILVLASSGAPRFAGYRLNNSVLQGPVLFSPGAFFEYFFAPAVWSL